MSRATRKRMGRTMWRAVCTSARAVSLGAGVAALSAGCGGGGGPSPVAAPLSASARTPEGLTVTLAQAAAAVSAGGTLRYTLTLSNATPAPVSYPSEAYLDGSTPLPGGLTVYGTDGLPAYPVAESASPPPPSHPVTVTLQPGQSQAETQSIPASYFARGQYHTVATFSTSGVSTVTLPVTVQ